MGVPGKKNSDAILFFSNIPWPTVRAPRGPDDITKEAVASLVLSSSHSHDKNVKARLRELLLLWHPDKFVGRYGSLLALFSLIFIFFGSDGCATLCQPISRT
jgi:hypothetical protein